MFTTPTTLILGAGASKPYGYPLGDELMQRMVDGAHGMGKDLLQLDCEADVIQDFRNSLKWSGLMSIDAYLSRVTRHRAVGRLALAHQMLHADKRGNDFSKDWLGYVWRTLIEGITKPQDLARNCLAIVTFNYDTSVERFLTNAIKFTFDVTIEKAAKYAEVIPIVHVYGSLPTVWRGTEVVDPSPVTLEAIRGTAQRIQVLDEGRNDSEDFTLARRYLKAASLRVFLGFGYIEENMRRLQLKEWMQDRAAPYGTVYGLSRGEISRIQRVMGAEAGYSMVEIEGSCEDGVRFLVDGFTKIPTPRDIETWSVLGPFPHRPAKPPAAVTGG